MMTHLPHPQAVKIRAKKCEARIENLEGALVVLEQGDRLLKVGELGSQHSYIKRRASDKDPLVVLTKDIEVLFCPFVYDFVAVRADCEARRDGPEGEKVRLWLGDEYIVIARFDHEQSYIKEAGQKSDFPRLLVYHDHIERIDKLSAHSEVLVAV